MTLRIRVRVKVGQQPLNKRSSVYRAIRERERDNVDPKNEILVFLELVGTCGFVSM